MDAFTARNDWRALRLAGVTPDEPLLAQGRFRRCVRTDQSPAYLVDLDAVRGAGGNYLSLLSANTRSQIKRSAKDYGGGTPVMAAAATAAVADAWLAEMAALNTGRHADNAWDDAGFRAFARALALAGLRNGEVELLRFTLDGALLGLLLNFRYRGRAMNYQSAFAAPLTAKAKPGLMCHAAAVTHYAASGDTLYSLLAGKDRYKQSLATGEEQLEWWTLERFSPRLEAEALLRRLLKRPASA
jgi:CelD/BcsL family acetyltransferase involved in cellulose biosynthesis